jgi:hypothetical protein
LVSSAGLAVGSGVAVKTTGSGVGEAGREVGVSGARVGVSGTDAGTTIDRVGVDCTGASVQDAIKGVTNAGIRAKNERRFITDLLGWIGYVSRTGSEGRAGWGVTLGAGQPSPEDYGRKPKGTPKTGRRILKICRRSKRYPIHFVRS